MPKPALRPTTRLRAVLYLRQSTFREESISLELQEHAGREHCNQQGYDVVAVLADPGVSGRTWNRPAVQQAMKMIEDREADVIVLWKWSRLSRSRLDWAVAADRIETLGGRIESATEPIDTTTSTGRFARGMLTEFAAFESERIGDVWRETHQRRVANGLPANGKPRFGYTYSRDTGFTMHPVDGPVLADTYRRYIAGESVYSLVAWLNAGPTRPASGYGSKSDGLWSDRTLRRVMDSGFAAGFITSRGERLPGAHEALITESEWEAYLEARDRRRVYRRTERSEYLLSGLVWCACGSKMHAGQFGSSRTPKYRCKDAHEKRTHTGGYVSETVLEEEVRRWLADREHRVRRATTEALERRAGTRVGPDPADTLRAQLRDLEAKQERLAERLITDGIPQATYARLRDRYTAEHDAVTRELRTVEVRRTAPIRVLPVLLERWGDLLVHEKREALRSIIDRVVVTPGRPRSSVEIRGRD
ncbi:recombinase family protein [Microbacterium sp. QXD-8]|uniref:Recombinase family protein n=1 Tax=Microbacterium psychrotolerans TaxID=3068321 RepID=A0ABU0YYA8_9MICO|nr:recombinase family protein [Microbacterium sp. QXD-8]MDQ7877315.1 recombinase family protein [Microbacterium sp. QXD-8]